MRYSYASFLKRLRRGYPINFSYGERLFAIRVQAERWMWMHMMWVSKWRDVVFVAEIERDLLEVLFARARLGAQAIQANPLPEEDKERRACVDFLCALVAQGIAGINYKSAQLVSAGVTKYTVETEKYAVDELTKYKSTKIFLEEMRIQGRKIEDIFDKLNFSPFG